MTFLDKYRTILLVAGVVFLIGIGFVAGRIFPTSSQEVEPSLSSVLSQFESKAIIQRTFVAKGTIKELLDNQILITPVASEDEQDVFTLTVGSDTNISIRNVQQGVQEGEPVLGSLNDLRVGDRVDAIMYVSAEGVVSINALTAIRER